MAFRKLLATHRIHRIPPKPLATRRNPQKPRKKIITISDLTQSSEIIENELWGNSSESSKKLRLAENSYNGDFRMTSQLRRIPPKPPRNPPRKLCYFATLISNNQGPSAGRGGYSGFRKRPKHR